MQIAEQLAELFTARSMTIDQTVLHLISLSTKYKILPHSGESYEPYRLQFEDGSILQLSNWDENETGIYVAIEPEPDKDTPDDITIF
nr:hypothetical protein [uncultured Arsenicibacter sp.]